MADRLTEIEARWAKTTPGPWKVCADDWEDDHCAVYTSGYRHPKCAAITHPDRKFVIADSETGRANATAIAAAPDDIAYLAAEVRRLRALGAEAAAFLDTLDMTADGGAHEWCVSCGGHPLGGHIQHADDCASCEATDLAARIREVTDA